MHEAEGTQRQEILLRRLSELGLAVKPLPDGRGVAVTLPLGPERFPLLRGGSARFESVSFASVGGDRIKCLRPLPFFYLPLIRVGGCASAEEFEARIRAAWRARSVDLLRTRNWLDKLGLAGLPEADDAPVLCVALGVEDPESKARLFEPGRLVLPGRGPLSGVRLRRAEDRTFQPSPSLASGLDVELAAATRLEELARLDARIERERARMPGDETTLRPIPALEEGPRVLLVGPNLYGDRTLHESLRLRGYSPLLARSERDALRTLEATSPELVLSETQLGRFEGIELIPELRTTPGVEEIPVVLVDTMLRPERRDAARRAGAAGYLVRPFEVDQIAAGLRALVQNPKRRRFRRYARQLTAIAASARDADVVADIGRGGMLVWTARSAQLHDVDHWSIALPEIGASVGVRAEVVYVRTVPGSARRGLGLRFRSFDDGSEAALIRFLRTMEATTREVMARSDESS